MPPYREPSVEGVIKIRKRKHKKVPEQSRDEQTKTRFDLTQMITYSDVADMLNVKRHHVPSIFYNFPFITKGSEIMGHYFIGFVITRPSEKGGNRFRIPYAMKYEILERFGLEGRSFREVSEAIHLENMLPYLNTKEETWKQMLEAFERIEQPYNVV